MRHALLLTALLSVGWTAATAQTTLEPVLQQLRNQGLTDIEVTDEAGKVRIEARGGGFERELVYDAGTGRLLEDDFGPERISLLPEAEVAEAREEPVGALMPQMPPPASAAIEASGSMAPIIDSLRADGYSRIEVAPAGNFIRLAAQRDGFRREMTYDAVSGALISDVMRANPGDLAEGEGGDDSDADAGVE